MRFGKNRLLVLALFFFVFFLSAICRLFYLQAFKGDFYQEKARKQQFVSDTVLPERGNIYLSSRGGSQSGISDSIPIALTRAWYNVWVSPKEIPFGEKNNAAQKLSDILGVDIDVASERIGKENDPYEPIKDKVDKEKILEIKNLKLKGVHWEAFQDRYYPLVESASQVIGFVSGSNTGEDKIKNGKYGIEGYFNDDLKGESGYIAGVKKALGSIVLPLSRVVKAKKGNDIYLTIDYNIQIALEKELRAASEKFSADGASAIVMDPNTGAILAMASVPSFNPNKFNEVKNSSVFLNPNIQLVFEPGSIFKPVTMAAALDINVVSPDLTYEDTGEVQVGPYVIRNSTRKSWGKQNMSQVLEKSLNTGVIFVLKRMPAGVWREYVSNFGFSEKTGVTLSGEAKGDISNLKSGVEIDWLTSSFGQGISVTPIAMISAISAIANGGDLLKPFVVSKIIDSSKTGSGLSGSVSTAEEKSIAFKGERVLKRKVIKGETSRTLTNMLVGVVENGSGKQARIPGYTVAGKTGTAQVSGPTGGYSDKTIHTFVGYSPAFNPSFAMLVKIDNPKGVEFSEASAAPVFKNVGEFILHYFGITPDKAITK